MGKYSQTIEYNLKTSLDSSGILKLQQELQKTARVIRSMASQSLFSEEQAQKSLANINKISQALAKSFNPTTGMLSTQQLVKSLDGLKLSDMQKDFARLGTVGTTSFNNIVGELAKVNIGVTKTNKNIDKMFNSFTNTVRWGVISSGFNSMRNSIQQSVQYMKDLDDSLTQIMMVTDYSRDSMNQYAKDANRVAKELGSTTVAMTNASLVFAQQGFDLNQSQHLAELSTKVANASQQTTAEASDQITAYMNAYGLDKDMEALDAAMDAWAMVANVSAADVGELAAASQKAASAAVTVGVSMDQLNGQIAAIESVTREAPEQIGNGLKTLYARLSDIQMGETLEDGVDLGKVTSTLENIGVQVLDGGGQMRNVGDIMEDLMAVWKSLDQTEKAAVAQTLAGKHQLARFEALMNRSDLYEEYKSASENAVGTLDTMTATHVDSLEGHLNQLQVAWENVALSFAETDSFYDAIDVLTTLVETFSTFIESIGGGGQALLSFGSIATRVFSKQLAQNLTRIQFNRQVRAEEKQAVSPEALAQLGFNSDLVKQYKNQDSVQTNSRTNDAMASVIETALSLHDNQGSLSDEQIKEVDKTIEATINAANKYHQQDQKLKDLIETTNWINGFLTGDRIGATVQEDGAIDFSGFDTYREDIDNQLNKQGEDIVAQVSESSGKVASRLKGVLSSIDRIMDQNDGLNDLSHNDLSKEQYKLRLHLEDILKMSHIDGEMDRPSTESSPNLLDDIFYQLRGNKQKDMAPLNKVSIQREKLAKSLQQAREEGDEAAEKEYLADIERIDNQVDQLREKIRHLIELLAKIEADPEANYGSRSAVESENEKRNMQEHVLNAAQSQNETARENVEDNAAFNNAIQSIGAMSELASSVMIIGNLGTILANEDLSGFEKFSQIATNLTFSIPSIISSLLQMSQIDFKNLKQLGSFLIEPITSAVGKFKELSASMKTSENGATGFIAKLKAMKGSLSSTQIAVLGLEGAFAVLSIGMMAYNFLAEKARQKDQALADSITETSDAISNTSSITNTWNETFENYRNGIATTEDLARAHNSLGGVMETAEMKVAASNGQWERYNDLLQENIRLQAEQQQAEAGANYEQAKDDAEKNVGLGNAGDLKEAGFLGPTQYRPLEGYGADHIVSDGNGGFLFSADATADDMLVELPKAIEGVTKEIQKEQEKLNDASLSDEERERIENTIASKQETLTKLNDLRGKEAYQALEGSAQAKVDSAISLVNNSPEYEEFLDLQEGESLDAYKKRVMNSGLGISEGMIDAFVEGMTSANPDSELAQAQIVENAREQGYEVLEERFKNYDSSEKFTESENLSVEGPEGVDVFSDFAFDIPAFRTGLAHFLVDQSIKSIQDNMDLSEEDKASIIGGIDWSKPIGNILQYLSRAAAGEDVGSMHAEEDRQAEAKARLNISDDFIDVYAGQLEDTTDIGQKKKDLENVDYEQQLESRTEKIRNKAQREGASEEQVAKDIEQAENSLAKERDKNNKVAQEYDETLHEMALNLAQSQKGLDALTNSFKKNYNILKDGDKTTVEYTEAMVETKQAIADLFNISSEDISNDFIESHLEEIKALSEGNLEGLDELGRAAAQDYLINLSTTGNLSSESLTSLQEQINNLDLEDIEVGANVDTTDFIDSLNNMLASGEMTQQQVDTVLKQIRLQPHYESEIVDTEIFSTAGMHVDIPNPFDDENPWSIRFPPLSLHAPIEVPQIVPEDDKGGGSGLTRLSAPTTNSAGIAPRSTNKTGGGGGGGGGKGKKSKRTKPLDEKHDRYEKINTQLGITSKELEKIADEEDRLVGQDKLNNLEKQCDILREQITLQKEKLKIQKQEAAELKKSLSQDYGVRYDSEGVITNYKEVFYKLQDEVNAAQKKADKDSENEAAQNALDKAKERFDEFKKDHDRYNQLISDEIAGTENEIAGLQDQIEDLRIDIFNSSIDAAESLKDLRQSFIELQDVLSQGLEEDPFKDYKTSIKQLNLLIQDTDKNIGKIGYGADNVLSRDYTNLVDILREIETMEKTGRSDIFGENTAEMWETAHNIYETAQGDIEEYSDAIKDLYGNVQDMIDSISEMYERQNEKYEDLSNELEHYSDIITMLHGEDAYAELENVYAAQNHVYESQIEFQKNQLAQLRHEQSLFDPEKQKEAWQNLEDQIRDTENSISDLVNSSLANLRTMYENSVSSILDSWTKGAMGNDLDWLSTEWELLNRNADYYLDDVNKAFNIQQLQSKYLDMMDANNDVLLQQKISKQMEQQLGYLREKTKLSEYDVQYANAQLDILQKQIALEEAQQNKNQLKLRRDSQGNYSYAYAANENNIREAQRALDEANNNAYNMSKEQMKKTQEDAFAALSDAKSQLEEIWNSTLSDKEKQARSQTVIDSLKEYLTNTEKELTTAQKNILNDFIDATTNLDDENKGNLDSIMKEILAGNTEAFDQIDTRFDTSRTDWMHNMDAFLSKSDEAYSQLIAASQRYQEQIKKLGEQTGTDFSDMNNLIQGTVDRTDALNKSSKELDATIQQMNVDLEKAVDSLNQFLTIFEKLSEAEFIQKLDNLLQALVEKEKEDAELANKMSGRKNKPTKVKDGVEEEPLNKPTPGTDSSNFTMTRPSALSVGSTVHLKPGAVYHEQSSGEGGQGSHNDATLIHHISGSGAYPIFLTTQSGMPRGWVRKEDLEGFRTGGYTGSWSNDDGKLALLHQKELILNEQDTQNILKAVSLVRDFAESFKSQMFTNPFTDLHKITAPLNPHTDVDQQIHITAEFPNAESASEIKDALLSLSDMAIQHSFTH